MIALRPGIVAKGLKISRATLYRWTQQNVIPDRCVVQWGPHRIRYDADELRTAGFKLEGVAVS